MAEVSMRRGEKMVVVSGYWIKPLTATTSGGWEFWVPPLTFFFFFFFS
jgi:hypothetical protein